MDSCRKTCRAIGMFHPFFSLIKKVKASFLIFWGNSVNLIFFYLCLVKKCIALFLLVLFSLVSTPRELWHHCIAHSDSNHCEQNDSGSGSIDNPGCDICKFQLKDFSLGKPEEFVLQSLKVFDFFVPYFPPINVIWGDCVALRGPPELL